MDTRRPLVLSLAVMLVVVLVMGNPASGQESDGGFVAVEGCTGEAIELNGYEKRTLDLHNQARAENGLQPLCVHPVLTEGARAHSQEMLNEGYFGHESFDGEPAEARLQRFGYTPEDYSYWSCGENIGWGTGRKGLPDERFGEWMESPVHREHILDEGFREIGIGVRMGKTYEQGAMYTVDFGTRL